MKSKMMKVIIALAFPVVFNLLFFLIGGTEQSELNWVCYGFINAAFLCMLLTPAFESRARASAVLTGSLYLRVMLYVVAELAVGLAFMAAAPADTMWAILTQSVMLAVFVVMQLMGILANDATGRSLARQRAASLNIRSLAGSLQMQLQGIDDAGVRRQVAECHELLRNSPIETPEECADADVRLREAVEALCGAVESGDADDIKKQCGQVRRAVQNRNNLIRLSR